MNKLKIFVWDVDFMENWSPGLAVVIAENTEEAKNILLEKLEEKGMDYDKYKKQVFNGPDKIVELQKSAFYVSGGS